MKVQSMRLNRLDLNLLVGLDVLLTECNITRAARRLCLSQSTASGILGRLREYFGDELLVQSGRAMAPTPLALSLMEPVHEILTKITQTLETAMEFDPETTVRHFRVVASDFVSTVVMTDLVAQLNTLAPFVTIEILQPNERSMAQMERGEVDIIVMPERYLSRSYPCETLFSDAFSCIAWNGNTEVGAHLSETDFLRLGHVATSFGSHPQTAFDECFFKSIGLARRIEVLCSAFNLLPHFVMGTQRIATLPSQLARRLADYYPVRVFEPPVNIPRLVESMQWHPSNHNDLAHIWLRTALRRAAQACTGAEDGAPCAIAGVPIQEGAGQFWTGPVPGAFKDTLAT